MSRMGKPYALNESLCLKLVSESKRHSESTENLIKSTNLSPVVTLEADHSYIYEHRF